MFKWKSWVLKEANYTFKRCYILLKSLYSSDNLSSRSFFSSIKLDGQMFIFLKPTPDSISNPPAIPAQNGNYQFKFLMTLCHNLPGDIALGGRSETMLGYAWIARLRAGVSNCRRLAISLFYLALTLKLLRSISCTVVTGLSSSMSDTAAGVSSSPNVVPVILALVSTFNFTL